MYAVECHIRFYCTSWDCRTGEIITLAVRPSEPLLAEAAYEFRNNGTLSNPAHRLANIRTSTASIVGSLGSSLLPFSLLYISVRRGTTGSNRWVSGDDFMKEIPSNYRDV